MHNQFSNLSRGSIFAISIVLNFVGCGGGDTKSGGDASSVRHFFRQGTSLYSFSESNPTPQVVVVEGTETPFGSPDYRGTLISATIDENYIARNFNISYTMFQSGNSLYLAPMAGNGRAYVRKLFDSVGCTSANFSISLDYKNTDNTRMFFNDCSTPPVWKQIRAGDIQNNVKAVMTYPRANVRNKEGSMLGYLIVDSGMVKLVNSDMGQPRVVDIIDPASQASINVGDVRLFGESRNSQGAALEYLAVRDAVSTKWYLVKLTLDFGAQNEQIAIEVISLVGAFGSYGVSDGHSYLTSTITTTDQQGAVTTTNMHRIALGEVVLKADVIAVENAVVGTQFSFSKSDIFYDILDAGATKKIAVLPKMVAASTNPAPTIDIPVGATNIARFAGGQGGLFFNYLLQTNAVTEGYAGYFNEASNQRTDVKGRWVARTSKGSRPFFNSQSEVEYAVMISLQPESSHEILSYRGDDRTFVATLGKAKSSVLGALTVGRGYELALKIDEDIYLGRADVAGSLKAITSSGSGSVKTLY